MMCIQKKVIYKCISHGMCVCVRLTNKNGSTDAKQQPSQFPQMEDVLKECKLDKQPAFSRAC